MAGRRALPFAGGMYLADARRPLQFHAPDGYLFTVRGNAAALMRRAGARPVYPEIGVWHVEARRGPALRDQLLARGLLHDTATEQRRLLREIPGSDPLVTTEWWKDNVDAEGIDLPTPRKRLLIIDAGLAVAHPEFAGRPSTVLENAQDVTFAPKKSGRDHGTRVASIAGAPVNGQGISGVFPTVQLGVWDAGGADGFTIAQELRAIRRGVSKRYSVVNMSFGSTIARVGFVNAGVRAEALGIARGYGAGLLFVAAAGNEFEDPKDPNPYEVPAGTPHVFTAAASTPADTRATFSNVQPYNDVAAPGEELVLARPAPFGAEEGGCDPTNQWCQTQGTSFSSPLVAGAAALVWSARPSLNVGQLEGVLRSSARDVGPTGYDSGTGYGILAVRSALDEPAQAADLMEPNEDTVLVDGTVFGRPDQFILGPRPRRVARSIVASVDLTEDPVDLYRVAAPANSTLTFTLRPLDDDVDLAVWDANVSGTGFYDRPDEPPLARRSKRGLRVETITLRGPSRGMGVGYIQVFAPGKHVGGAYELTVRRR